MIEPTRKRKKTMKHRRHFRIIFWSLVVLGFAFLLGSSSPVVADLGGSSVTFVPSVEYEPGKFSASCYIPGEYWQTLCFSLDTTTTDGEDAGTIIMKFPSDWEVGGFWKVDHYEIITVEQSCSNGGTMSPLLSWMGYAVEGQYWGDDARVQNGTETCHATYCFHAADNTDPGDPPYTDPNASVSWAWTGDISTVCTNDDFNPGWSCTETTGTPANVPVCEFVPLTILPETLPVGEAATYYSQQFTAEDPLGNVLPNEQVSWTYNPGELPQNCYVNTGIGKLECYADYNESPLPAGNYDFTVYVNSINGWADGFRDYTLVINPLLLFDPEKLPYGRVNQAFTQIITVSNGTGPYILTHTAGTLPTGLSFDEATDSFTGTPTEAGTFGGIVVQAVDANNVTKTNTYSLTILPEHLFTWTPLTPTSGETTSFTGFEGFGYYEWYYASQPGGECDLKVYTYSDSRFADINFYGNGEHKVCLTMYEYVPPYSIILDDQWVTVTNSPPNIDGLDPYPSPSFPGQDVESTAYFSDPDDEENYTCEIDWGDGNSGMGTYEPYGQCVFPPHSYTSAGSYTLQATVTDGEGASDTQSSTHKVVYLYPEQFTYLLASNTRPTTMRLRGYAPEGTTSLQFTVNSPPLQGNLVTPSFQECRALDYEPGTVMCEAEVVYTPKETSSLFVGDDQFTFGVEDTSGHKSESGFVNLWVDENQAPVAYDGTATVLSSEPSDFTIYAYDEDFYAGAFDDLTFHLDSQPQHGSLTITGYSHYNSHYDSCCNVIGMDWRKSFPYTPNPGVNATTDSFRFHVNDTHQDSNTATITLNLYTPQTLHVNTPNDVVDVEGCTASHCSLREAVEDALIGDTIDFTLPLPNTITLTEGEILISKNIHISGPGAEELAVSAGFMDPDLPISPSEGYRVFQIDNDDEPMKATISGLTIRDGRDFEGGGIFVDEEAELILTDCQIGPNNIVEYAGGGISTDEAVLTMINCTVINNHGTGTQGGAGIYVDDTNLTIINSTITGNVTNNYGGGILAYDDTVVTLIHSTITGNLANQDYDINDWGGGGGIYNDGAEVVLWNTIVAGNTDLTETTVHAKWPDVYGATTSQGGNLIGDDTGSTGWLPGDMVGTAASPIDPMFGALAVFNPVKTPVYPLLKGSPAIDAVACVAGVTADQRGVKRPQGITCDIGAFELEDDTTILFLPLILR